MKAVAVVLAVLCLASFTWARGAFFRKTAETRRRRGGLRPLGTVWGVCSLLLVLLSRNQEIPLYSWTAVCGFVLSLMIFWMAIRAFKDSRPAIASTAEVPAVLVTVGPYKWIRHPFYLAYMLYWVSVPIWLSQLVLLVPAVVLFAVYYRTAKEEESAMLSSDLQDVYRLYMSQAGMFFPKIRF